jgi:hypothetical protein
MSVCLSVTRAQSIIKWHNEFSRVVWLVQIQVRTWKCWPTVSCNCAVVVREDNNVLGLNGCGLNGNVLPINYLDAKTSGASIRISPDGYSYEVRNTKQTNVIGC